MLKRVAVPVTTLTNTLILKVPQNERWIVKDVFMENCTLSSGSNICQVLLRDTAAAAMGAVIYNGAATTAEDMVAPHMEGTETMQVLGHGAYPLVLIEDEELYFSWVC